MYEVFLETMIRRKVIIANESYRKPNLLLTNPVCSMIQEIQEFVTHTKYYFDICTHIFSANNMIIQIRQQQQQQKIVSLN